MPTIQTTTGNVVLHNGSARCLVFHCPRPGGKGGDGEHVLEAAAMHARIGTAVKRISGWSSDVPAVNGYNFEMGGRIRRSSFDVAEGEIIKIVAQRRAPGNPASAAVAMSTNITANRFYRVRTGAAVIKLFVKMLNDFRCPCAEAEISGPLEALTLEQALVLGVHVRPEFRKQFDPRLCAFLMREEVLQPAEQVCTTVQTKTGVEVVLVPTRKRRLIDTV